MRTTLAIDDDVLAAARHLAEMQSRTIGEVVSPLARQGLRGHAPHAPRAVRNGVLLLPGRGSAAAVTPELVNRLRDEVTDSYLLALAKAHGGRLASMDRKLVVDAVKDGAQALKSI